MRMPLSPPATAELASLRPSSDQSRLLTASRWPPGTLRGPRAHEAAVNVGSSLDVGRCEMGTEEEEEVNEAGRTDAMMGSEGRRRARGGSEPERRERSLMR